VASNLEFILKIKTRQVLWDLCQTQSHKHKTGTVSEVISLSLPVSGLHLYPVSQPITHVLDLLIPTCFHTRSPSAHIYHFPIRLNNSILSFFFEVSCTFRN